MDSPDVVKGSACMARDGKQGDAGGLGRGMWSGRSRQAV